MLWGLEINIGVFQQCGVGGLGKDFHVLGFFEG